ncbi:Dolichyl-diphosphooligosaccharide-protein glycosyltransferase subunit OST5 [Pleurotus pulmonarius]
MSNYEAIKVLHNSLPPFAPAIPVAALPFLALVLLSATFGLAFYFTTLPKDTVPLRELGVASTASLLGGFGVVALFCSAGVYV